MQNIYNRRNPPASRIFYQSTEHAPEGMGGLCDVLSLEREARKLGDRELLDIAEKIKDAHGRLLRGECIPPNELEELMGFVGRYREPAVAEVVAGG